MKSSLRIIAGEFRGRRLLPPEGDVTRPITDRAKQSLFDIISDLIPGAYVYDLFAGTGSMGLESLSRGAAGALFFERDWSARSRLRQNIQSLRLTDKSQIVTTDIFAWFEQATALPPPPAPAASTDAAGEAATNDPVKPPTAIPLRPADLVFLDPPYSFLTDRPVDLLGLADKLVTAHLAPDGRIIFRHDAKDSLALPDLKRYDLRTYGGMTIEFLRREPAG
ncbi:MAG TPA: RsmD family RNA methyltransferase [Tepidisphaeraceae bacterium]|jgi:16S rRNA G966 N2-methylase RsmD